MQNLGQGKNGARFAKADLSSDKRNLNEHKVDRKKVLLRLWKYIGSSKYLVILAILLVLFSTAFSLFGPKLSGQIIEYISTAEELDISYILTKSLIMLSSYVLSFVLAYALSLTMLQLSKNIVYQMRRDTFERLLKLKVQFFDTYQAGDIISVITYDIDTVNQTLANDLLQLLQSILTVGFSLIMMLTISPIMIVIFLVTIPLEIYVTRTVAARTKHLFKLRSRKLGELNGYVEEMLSGHKTIKSYNVEDEVLDGFEKINEEAIDAYTKAEYKGRITGPIVMCFNNASLAVISIFGALLYLGGKISLGDISSFIQYSRQFSGPINEAANITGELQSAFSATERVFELMDEEPEKLDIENALSLYDVKGDVNLKDVCFSYVKDKPILLDISFEASKGKLIAIVGPTGSGKTTIINLLMRFYDIDSGSILVDGNDIYSVTRDSLRRSYTMVLQDTWLFNGTIYENIAYGNENVTMDDVVRVAKAAKIHDFIAHLPNGYNTKLSDNGVNISKGQKQLLTIARAMLIDSNMLILDEATSNVDTQTEMQIQSAIRKLMKDKTCFVIAHRLSTIQNADNIIVIKDGHIVESGTHDELIENDNFYASLYFAQFETV